MRGSRTTLLLLVAVAVGLRLWAAHPLRANPYWNDPDGYLDLARELGDGARPWHWSIKSVEFAEFFKAPLYQTLLSVATAHPSVFPLPQAGFVLHALLGGVTVVALFWLGASLQDRRAGLLAAAAWACWLPNILITSSFWQEHLLMPLLVTGLALLARAADGEQPAWRWAAAGVALGLAALTRSAVMYYVPVAAAICVAGRPRSRAAPVRGAGLVGGFAVATLPYIVFISLAVGRFMPIENIGTWALKHQAPPSPSVAIGRFMKDPSGAPSGAETARYLAAVAAADPSGFVVRHVDLIRSLLKPAGASMLVNTSARSAASAFAAKAGVHAAIDLPFAAALILAPFGLALSRNRLAAWLLAAWAVQYLVLLSLTLWAGTRFRSPVEPVVITLAAVVIARQPRVASRAALAWAAAAAVLVALLVGPGLGSALRARANYGVASWDPVLSREATVSGRAGLNVAAAAGDLTILLEPEPGVPDTEVSVRVNGQLVETVTVGAGQASTVHWTLPVAGLVYLEVSSTGPGGRPAATRMRIGAVPGLRVLEYRREGIALRAGRYRRN